jgi:hypothetical protein
MSVRQASAIEPSSRPDRSQTTTAWRRFVPWQGPTSRTDMAVMGAILGVVALGLVLRPLKPFLLASQPVTLEFLTGDLTAIGAAAAFARIGEAPLWLVVVAGAAGMVKLDLLTWWTGRQWGGGIIKMFTTSERVQRFADRATELDPKILRAAVVLAVLPGVPTAVVYANGRLGSDAPGDLPSSRPRRCSPDDGLGRRDRLWAGPTRRRRGPARRQIRVGRESDADRAGRGDPDGEATDPTNVGQEALTGLRTDDDRPVLRSIGRAMKLI